MKTRKTGGLFEPIRLGELVSMETAEHLLQRIGQRAEARRRELELGVALGLEPFRTYSGYIMERT